MLSLALVFLLLITSCTAEGPADREALRINLGTEPPTLDWNLATDSTSHDVIINIMEGLTQYDENLRPVPAVAQGWQVFGKRVVFNLRRDVYWSDGVPVTAHDFEYSWKRLLNPKTAAEYAYFLYDLEGAEEYNTGKIKDPSKVGVRALDDYTLEVRLKHPVPYFLSITTFMVTYPMRRDVVERYGDGWTEPGRIVTNGPFKLAEWRHENKIVLAPNPRYYGERPRLKRVEMFMINEASTALSLYEKGELDIADGRSIPATEIPRLRARPDYRNMPMLRGNYIGFNVTKPPFNDVRVRRAFAMAIDRRVFPKVLKGGEVPTTSWVPPALLGHNPDVGIRFDPEGARRLLAQVGSLPPVKLYYNTDENNRLVAEALQAMWKENLGVEVKLINQEWKVYLKTLNTDPPQLFRLGWSADFPDPDNFMNLFTSQSGNNNTRWGDGRYDELIRRAASQMDEKVRASLYTQAQRLLLEEGVAIVPLFFTSQSVMIKPHVRGFWLNPMGILRLKTVSMG